MNHTLLQAMTPCRILHGGVEDRNIKRLRHERQRLHIASNRWGNFNYHCGPMLFVFFLDKLTTADIYAYEIITKNFIPFLIYFRAANTEVENSQL